MKKMVQALRQFRIVMLLAVILPAISLSLAFPAITLAQGPVTPPPAPAFSEADYAMAAYTGMDPASIATIEAIQAKDMCAGLSGADCANSYVARTNAVAHMLGVPTILTDVGDNVGQLNFAGKILNAIGHLEYPDTSGVSAAAKK